MAVKSEDVPISTKPEFLPFIPSNVTQRIPRRVLKLCVVFASIGLCFTIVCLGVLGVMMYSSWYLFFITVIHFTIMALLSFWASFTGKTCYITGLSVSSLLNLFASIALMCFAMTDVSDAFRVLDNCTERGTLESMSPAKGVACASYSNEEMGYNSHLASNGASLTGIVALHGAVSIMCNGYTMVNAFFLARMCRSKPPNWMVESVTSSSANTKKVHESIALTQSTCISVV